VTCVTAHPGISQPGTGTDKGTDEGAGAKKRRQFPTMPPMRVTADASPEVVRRRPAAVPQQVSVRPSFLLHGFIALGGLVLAVGFTYAAADATGIGATGRWIAAAAFAVLAVIAIRAMLSGPLLVADSTGIRLRIKEDWVGARWSEIDEVTVLPRRYPLADGRIAIHLEDPGPVLSAMSSTVRKLTDANRRLTGSSLAAPFGFALRPAGTDGMDVTEALRLLADGRCAVTVQP
jgi:hypothetical protein